MKPASEVRLTEWESTTRLIGLTVATGYIKGAKAQSLLLVGAPGEGKSELIRRFNAVPTVQVLSDVTPFGLKDALSEDKARRTRHILVTELARCLYHDFQVSQQFITLLCNLTSGDAGHERVGKNTVIDLSDWQIGIVSALTDEVFKRQRDMLESAGLLSRMIVVPLKISREEQERIMDNQASGRFHDLTPIHWPHLTGVRQVPIELPAKMGHKLLEWYKQLKFPGNSAPARFHDRLRTFLKAAAYLNGNDVVTPFDLETLRRFEPFFKQEKSVRMMWPINPSPHK